MGLRQPLRPGQPEAAVAGAAVVVHCAGRSGGLRPNKLIKSMLKAWRDWCKPLGASDATFLLISSLAARAGTLIYARRASAAVKASAHSGRADGNDHLSAGGCRPGTAKWRRCCGACSTGGYRSLRSASGFRCCVQDLARADRHTLERSGLGAGPFEIHDGRPGGYSGKGHDHGLPHPEPACAGGESPGVAQAARGQSSAGALCGTLPMLTPARCAN
jgi:hypothetical protein